MNKRRRQPPRHAEIRPNDVGALRPGQTAAITARDVLGGDHKALVWMDEAGKTWTVPLGQYIAINGDQELRTPVYRVPGGEGTIDLLAVKGVTADEQGRRHVSVELSNGDTVSMIAEPTFAQTATHPVRSTRTPDGNVNFGVEDVEAYESLSDALDVIGTERAVLAIKNDVLIDSDITIPENITLQMEAGAIISVETGKSLTIESKFSAYARQIFACADDGSQITFAKRQNILPEWFGTTDLTASIQAVIDSADGSVRDMLLTEGTYELTSLLTVPANIRTRMKSGALLSWSSGKAPTFSGRFNCPDTEQAFDCDVGDEPTLESVRHVTPFWFGAAADGVTDDTGPVQSALNCSQNLFIPAADYLVGGELDGQALPNGGQIIGQGRDRSRFYFEGAADGDLLLEIDGPDHISIADVGFLVDSGYTATYCGSGLKVLNSKRVAIERCSFRSHFWQEREATVAINAALVAGDTITITIDSTDYAETYATSSDATMTAVASACEADAACVSASYDSGTKTITLTLTAATTTAVTLAASVSSAGAGTASATVSGRDHVDAYSDDVIPASAMQNGVFFDTCESAVVRDCDFEAGMYSPVRFRKTSRSLVSSCYFEDTVRAIMYDDNSPAGVDAVQENNVYQDIRHTITKMENAVDGGQFIGNRITISSTAATMGQAAGLIVNHSSYSLVQGNIIRQHADSCKAQSAISVEGPAVHARVHANSIIGGNWTSRLNDDYGELGRAAITIHTNLGSDAYISVDDNDILGQSADVMAGISVVSRAVMVTKNRIVGDGIGVGVDRVENGVYLAPKSLNTTVRGNSVRYANRGIFVDDAGQYDIQGNNITDTAGHMIELHGLVPIGTIQNNRLNFTVTAGSTQNGIHFDGKRFDVISYDETVEGPLLSIDSGNKTGIPLGIGNNPFSDGDSIEVYGATDSDLNGVWTVETESDGSTIVINLAFASATAGSPTEAFSVQGVGILRGVRIAGNQITGGYKGLYLRNERGIDNFIYDIQANDNYVEDTRRDGIHIERAYRYSVLSNHIKDVNQSSGSTTRGILLKNSSGVSAIGNIQSGTNVQWGMFLQGVDNFIALGNQAESYSESGCTNGYSQASLVDNIFATQGPLLRDGNGAGTGTGTISELLTIPVGSGSGGINTSNVLVPAGCVVTSVSWIVYQAPGGGAATMSIGRVGSPTEFANSVACATQGDSGTSYDQATPAGFLPNGTDKKLTVTTNADVTVSDMIVRLVVTYCVADAPVQ
ncbi:hypothetical protein KQI63_05800 [bacterium]|nr:hypothetical protein [bacterium]